MGQKLSQKPTVDLETEIKMISDITKLPEQELRETYQSFNSKGRVSKKDFIGGYKKFYPNALQPEALAERVFKSCDSDKNGTISFREFAILIYIMTKAPKKQKLQHIFRILDSDGNGSLNAREVIQAIKHAYDIIGELNFDYNCKGIEVFRAMDKNGDLKVNSEEFVSACLQDEKLCSLLEESIGAPAVLNASLDSKKIFV